MDRVVDAVGNTLTAGDKCMHARRRIGSNTPILKEVEVVEVISQSKIAIRTGENALKGYTYGNKLVKIIIEDESNK